MWTSLDKIFAFMEQKTWSNSELKVFGNVLDTWKKAFIAGWSDQHVTHYMVTT